MIDPVHYLRLEWIARHPDVGDRPPPDLFGVTTWPQEISEAVRAMLNEVDRLVEALERDAS